MQPRRRPILTFQPTIELLISCWHMSSEQQQLQNAIGALEAQRSLLGDAMVDMALSPLKTRLAAVMGEAAPAAEPAQALKQVSILFLDVVGSTTLSQRLDPEAISAVMDDALARGTVIVQAYRGRVLQYAGDNILAAFGADGADEDDAERAVHSGLALLKLGKVLAAEVQAAHHHAAFNVRVGIHTGGVLLGGGVDATGTIRGIAVNIAARMEQTAPAGALRISHDTYAQVRGLFEIEVQEPLAVKGVDAPIQSYLVLRAKPRNFRIGTRGIQGVATRMIGRDVEFEALQAAFKRLLTDRVLAAVTVVAEAGIGKSRLLYEFEAWSEARPESFFLFRGRATPQTGKQAFGLLRDILAWRFQIADDDSVEAARRKIEEGIVPLFVHDYGPELAEGHAHLLGHLIGIEWKGSRHLKGILDDPRQIRNRAFHAAAQLFRRVSATDGSPVILQLEDLHWADGESLDFLNYLAEVNRDVPLLVLSFTRPTLFERRSDWSSTEGIHARIDLHPLSKGHSRDLANELLKRLPEVPAALRELLTSNAEGNPFYMEELTKMLIDQGAIQTGETWKVDAERLLLTHVPTTLTGVLQSRLDGLPAAEKRGLQLASVVGAVFWDQALAAVDAQAADQLPALVRRQLAMPRADAQIEGLREYAFAHQVLHQVTYNTVLKRHKCEGHARVARWLASLAEQDNPRAGDLLGLAAEHFEHAGDEAQAAEFHARAAEQAGQRLAHERVLQHVGRALALLDAKSDLTDRTHAELRWRLLSVRQQTLLLLARWENEIADVDALAALAELLDDATRRAQVHLQRCMSPIRRGDWAALESAGRECMLLAEQAAQDEIRLNALRLVANALTFQGKVDAGRALAQQGLVEARHLNLRRAEGRVLNALAIAAGREDRHTDALDFSAQCLEIYREAGNRANEAVTLSDLGSRRLMLGSFAQARHDLEAALHLQRTNGDRVVEGKTLGDLSMLALRTGDDTRALAFARASLDIAVASQARDEALRAGLRLGDAELALGRTAAARQAYTQARQRVLSTQDSSCWDIAGGLARTAMAEGDGTAALAELMPILDHVRSGGALKGAEDSCLIEWTCFKTLAQVGNPDADGWLTRAHTALMAQAAAIADPALRLGFLQNIPHHREIVAAWARLSEAGSADMPAI